MNLFLEEDMIVPLSQIDKRIFSDIEKGTPFPTRRQGKGHPLEPLRHHSKARF